MGSEDYDARTPLISIILPTWNCEGYLEEALRSVLSQLPEDNELIVVDDGSADTTVQKLAELDGKSPNLRVAFRKHAGASAARNSGLDMARGKYVFFLDCDDVLRDGFLEDSLPLLSGDAALYIFGIERVPLDGESEFWRVKDRVYESISDFADEYVRIRKLLIYSNCNKFYRRSILERNGIRFDETLDFGEDRLFNYRFLSCCQGEGRIVTSPQISIRYMQRGHSSLSTKHVPDYFRRVMVLHEEKMSCFQSLAGGVSDEERLDFEAYDLSREIENTLARFQEHPEEKVENLPEINRLIFGKTEYAENNLPALDFLVVTGSLNCEYRVQKALEVGGTEVRYIVSGGNPHKSGECTEAEFMARYLSRHGVPDSRIFIENRSVNTEENLKYSAEIIRRTRDSHGLGASAGRIGIVTAAFHVPRAKLIAERSGVFAEGSVCFIGAYGENTGLHNWYLNEIGRTAVLTDFRKRIKLERDSRNEVKLAYGIANGIDEYFDHCPKRE